MVLALVAPSGAASAWRVRTLDGGRPTSLLGLAALPSGGTAALLQEWRSGAKQLVLQRPGRRPLTLMTSPHTFDAALGADARGHLAVAWNVIPSGGRFRRAYVWTGSAVRALTDGTRHASVSLTVSPAGRVAVAVNDGATGPTGSVTWVRRGSFRSGLSARRLPTGGLAYLSREAFRFAPAGDLALGGSLPPGGTLAAPVSVAAAPGPRGAFAPAAGLPRLAAPPGEQTIPQVLTVGFAPGGDVVAATSTLTCTIGTGDLGGACDRLTGSVLRVWRWAPGAPGPGAARVASRARFATRPVLATSGDALWLLWLDGATGRPDTLAAARIGAAGLGAVRRTRLRGGVRPEVGPDTVSAAPAPGGAVRVYLPAPGRPTSALITLRLTAKGTFGPFSTVVRGPRYAGPNTVVFPVLPVGLARDLVGWTVSSASGVGPSRVATP